MCIRYLGFVLLIWFPGALRAQGAQSCSAPGVDGGFIVPKQLTYSHGAKLTYTCNEGRKPIVKGWWATSTCHNGKWSTEPQCIESMHACSEPPKVPHAVIINQEYQEIFAADTILQYECEDGYTAERDETKNITCRAGNWTKGPTCRSSSSYIPSQKETVPLFTSISSCGAVPVVADGFVTVQGQRSLTYKCGQYYELQGPETVVCYNNGRWSQTPTCRAAYCSVNTAHYPVLVPDGVKFLRDGERLKLKCVDDPAWWTTHYMVFRCTNTRLTSSRCCDAFDAHSGVC